MDPNYWFNVARILTLIGGLMTVIGGFGLWHFGQLKDLNTGEKIRKSEETAAQANAKAANANSEAAKAITKSKEIELELTEAKKETEFAKQETEKVKLQVEETQKQSQQIEIKLEEQKERAAKAEKELIKVKEKVKDEQIAEDQKSLKLKEFLKIIPETNDNGSTFYSIYEYLKNNRFNSSHLSTLNELLDLSIDYPHEFHPDGNLRYVILITIFRDFPNKIFDNDGLYEEYTQKRLTKIINSGHNSEIIKRGVQKNIDKLYENGSFLSQNYFKDLSSFFQVIDYSKDLSDFTYRHVKSRNEKFQIYQKYYLVFLKSLPKKKYYWGKSLLNEYGENLTEEEKKLLENIK